MSLDVYLYDPTSTYTTPPLFEANITHNLNTMAERAGVYLHLWRPEEITIEKAGELIEPLENALIDLLARPEFYSQFNPPNGWGDYNSLVNFITKYLDACRKYPESVIEVSR